MEKEKIVLSNNETYDEAIKGTQSFNIKTFADLQRILLRDLNGNPASPLFQKYTKDEILGYLKDPYSNEKRIRDAIIYIYGTSSIFWRLVQYFASLSDLSYTVSPTGVDPAKAKTDTFKKNRLKTIEFLKSMNIKTQCREILTVCFREDVYYATCWLQNDKITIQQLPSDYCRISSIEDNVLNVSFDFSYFSGRNENLLPFYPAEFTTKYRAYQNDRRANRWQILDSPSSFAIKANRDIKNYAMPPLIGTLPSLYDLADYQDLQLSKTELENYALLFMKLSMTGDKYDIPYSQAATYFQNLASQLPDQIGAVLTPMNIEKIDFKDNGADRTANVMNAENSIFTAAGVSSLIFNNPKASSNALMLSIMADQALTFSVVQSIDDAINRILKAQSFGKNFKMKFIDVSRFNKKEVADEYLRAATYGLPTVSAYFAAMGFDPEDVETLNFMENDMLDLPNKLVPLRSSNTNSWSTGTGTVGRPRSEGTDLTDEGETSREQN